MFIILETCSIGVGANPEGGFTIKISDIEGFPGNILGLPIGEEAARVMHEQIGKYLGPKVPVFNATDMKGAVPRA